MGARDALRVVGAGVVFDNSKEFVIAVGDLGQWVAVDHQPPH